LGEELIGSDRPIVTVSGTPWVPGRTSTEADPLPTDGPVGGRGRSVKSLLGLASRGVRSTAVRIPRTVHNEGKGGFAGLLTDAARRAGVSGYPGDGTQRWPAVHALDAAVLFRLASSRHRPGRFGTPSATRATRCGTSRQSSAGDWARRSRRCRRRISARSARSSRWTSRRAHTRDALGWQPTHAGLLEDLENIQPDALTDSQSVRGPTPRLYVEAELNSQGESETIVGEVLRGRRDGVILATKFHGPMDVATGQAGGDPNQRGNSRRWIEQEVENSLKRLQTDWIDLYQVHRPNMGTDDDETLAH